MQVQDSVAEKQPNPIDNDPINGLKKFLQQIRAFWAMLVGGTAWMAGVVALLFLLPSYEVPGVQPIRWLNFAQFIFAILAALIFILSRERQTRNYMTFWVGLTLILLAAATIGFTTFQVKSGDWTGVFDKDRKTYILGPDSALTGDAIMIKYGTNALPRKSDLALLSGMGIQAYREEEIWSHQSLERRWLFLALLFVGGFQSVACCIMCLFQAVRCSKRDLEQKTQVVSAATGPVWSFDELVKKLQEAFRISLRRVPDQKGEARAADIVFIHGLDGTSESAWADPSMPDESWPRWLAQDFQETAVWLLGYETKSLLWAHEGPILDDIAKAVLNAFCREQIGERPFIIVAHSFGGILLKAILRQVDSSNAEDRFAAQLKGIVLISVPQTDQELESWVDYTRGSMASKEIQGFSKEAADFPKLNLWFFKFLNKIPAKVVNYREQRPVGDRLVVGPAREVAPLRGGFTTLEDADHLSIARALSREHSLYRGVRKFVQTCLPERSAVARP